MIVTEELVTFIHKLYTLCVVSDLGTHANDLNQITAVIRSRSVNRRSRVRPA